MDKGPRYDRTHSGRRIAVVLVALGVIGLLHVAFASARYPIAAESPPYASADRCR